MSPCEAGGTPDRAAIFERERPLLRSTAFRILSSDTDAEDAVQETWIRFDGRDTSNVRNLPAWLTTVVTRVCLDMLRRRRDVPQEPADLAIAPARVSDGPEELALLASELADAFVVILDELTPPQRVALILHDVFGAPFTEVAHVLGTSAGSAKKLASRARQRVRERADTPSGDAAEAWRVVGAFLHAAREGDTDGLIALLDPSVVRTADPQVLPRGGQQRIQGVEAVVAGARGFRASAQRAYVASIDGRPGIVVHSGSKREAVLVFRIVDGRVVQYDVIADPRRLALLHMRGGQPGRHDPEPLASH